MLNEFFHVIGNFFGNKVKNIVLTLFLVAAYAGGGALIAGAVVSEMALTGNSILTTYVLWTGGFGLIGLIGAILGLPLTPKEEEEKEELDK